MTASVRRVLLRGFGRLPRTVRAFVARCMTGSYFVGTLGYLVHDGRLVLVRPVYRGGWGAPGGLVGRKETPEAAVVRELKEELGLDVAIEGAPQPVIDPRLRCVNICFRCSLVGSDDTLRVQRDELDAAEWFSLDALPADLHSETRPGLVALGLAP